MQAREYCLAHTLQDSAATHARACTHTFSVSNPSALSFLALNQIEQPPQWTPQKQFGSQLAVEVVNNHQITVAGTFVENLTPRFYTDSLRSGNTHREMCWRRSKSRRLEMTGAHNHADINVHTQICTHICPHTLMHSIAAQQHMHR